jgi:UDP-N-acetyl-D-glucosamine dehydrogenase
VLLLGLSYKKNIEDTRESASLKIFKELYQNKKIKVDYYDPYVHFYKFKQIISKPLIKSINYKKNSFMKYQMLIIATDHDKFNYNKILNSNKIIVDLRGRFKNINKKNLFKL